MEGKELLRPLSRGLRRLRKLPQARALRKDLEKTLQHRDPSRPALWLLGAAVHGNLGDLAQRFCIEAWAERWLPEAQLLAAPTLAVGEDLPLLPGDRLLFQSGYTMTDFHPDEALRRRILARPLEQSILILPQTICYKKEDKRAAMADCLQKQPRLLLLARDEISLETAQVLAPGRAELCPDIVAGLVDFVPGEQARRVIGLCLRTDGESALTHHQRAELRKQLEALGPLETISTACAPGYEREKVRRLLEERLGQLSRLDLLVTDRLHGAIFGALAGTPLLLLPTKDHKLRGALPWLRDLCQGELILCEDLAQLPALAESLLGRTFTPGRAAAEAWEQLGRR